MSVDRSQRALELVDQALAMEPKERASWLRSACGDDNLLESEVLAMLRLVPAADGFLPLGDEAQDASRPDGVANWPAFLSTVELSAGSRLDDFRIEQQIGSGGMGVVYRARQVSLNRAVALKVLPAYLRTSASANSRFRREIEAAAKLHHTNIVSVYATGDVEGTLYYAMELVDGPPLSEVLEHLRAHPIAELQSATPHQRMSEDHQEPNMSTPAWAIRSLTGSSPTDGASTRAGLTPRLEASGGDYFDRIASALAAAADALAYAHNHDVVHRDVKPSNLLLSSDGRLHVSDFGLARFMHEPGLTRTGECLGTPYYMAPEQVGTEHGSVDGRADVYGMGATLYELLTLQPPFVGTTRDSVISQIAGSEPIPPRRLNKRSPRDLQTICMKALEKNPADRYQSGAEMASDLRAFVNRFAISARRVGPIVRTMKWARRHRGLAAALSVATVLALAAIFFALSAHRSQSLWTEAQQEHVFERALMAALEGKTDDARMAVDEARTLGAPAGRLQLLEGQVDLLASRYLHAHRHFELAATEMPDNVAAQSLLGRCCMKRKLYQQGELVYRRCETLQPRTLEDYLHLARLEAYFDAAKAVATLNKAVRRNRSSMAARLLRGDVQAGRAVDFAEPAIAEAALADYRIAVELLGNTPLVTSGHMHALLAAATAYQVHGKLEKRDAVLEQASDVARQLSHLNKFRAQHALAFYHEYVGEVERAIAEWRKFEPRQILYLVLALIRQGQFDEAKAICDKFQGSDSTSRELSFFLALNEAASGTSPTNVRDAFPLVHEVQLNPIHELLSVYTISRLVDSNDATQLLCQSLVRQRRLPALRAGWYAHLSDFACGRISSEQLLAAAGSSRKSLCEAYYYIALAQLANGNRPAAREHFQSSIDTGVYNYFEYHLSKALLAQLDRQHQWPEWIASVNQDE